MTFKDVNDYVRNNWSRLLMGLALLYVFFGNAGFRAVVSNWMQLKKLKGELAQLDKDERELELKLKSLRSSDGGIERAARRDLGYIKKGEIEYRFPPPGQTESRP